MALSQEDRLCECLLILTALLHVLICPFSKVEETLNLHAIHDILTKGLSDKAISQYDHITFTGPLPRSFIGALTVATATYPFKLLMDVTGLYSPLALQVILRSVLAFSNSLCLIFFARRLRDVFHVRLSRQFLILTCCQFHIMFWIGRTVPNMLVFGPVQVAIACTLLPKQRTTKRWSRPDVLLGLCLLTGLAVTMRLELLGLMAPLAVQAWMYDRVDWLEGSFAIISTAISCASLSLFVDSYFWQHSVWPELGSLIYNVIEGKSENWGVSPWYTYFLVSLPKIMQLAYPLFLAGIYINPVARRFAAPLVFYVCLMSILKHKEWRFISYVIPTFNIIALAAIARLRQMNRKLSRRVFRLVCGTSLAFTLVATVISTFNYPGAHTLLRLNNLLREEGATPQDTTVHLNAYSRMNGISDMVHNPSLARISKDESLTDAGQYTVFDYIVTHEPQLHSKAFNVVQGIKGWAGVRSQIPSLKKALTRRDWRFFLPAQSEGVPHYLSRVLPLQPRIEELVWIMRNKKRRSKENV
ncbi:glycosyltransferase family 22 protein [Cystobasidium minutum MCA 4210]|uniref:glycosyltransferase family 22 protein n=1 Tax=Cystobasidium minutum MCA 4210 TaxID=1397322 RepID=UPI0034CD87A4|eukprot:jgi/Rhomi1/93954/CE93953_377